MEIKGKSSRVRPGQVECVVKVHEECIALPSELWMNELENLAQWSRLAAVT